MSDVVISVENLSKRYRLGTIGGRTLREDFARWNARRRGKPDPYLRIGQTDYANQEGETVWALRDINLQVRQGEIVGIIGRNGAGKSTLLKILSRITAPTDGLVKVKGRIGSLLEVGTGFHPELTGRENIYLNGAILGMTRAEVDRKLDEIVDFSGVEQYIDTPVKRYSSGMYVRLAFAVAAHLEPEILIVDEVLAVGDAAFRDRCVGKMGEVGSRGIAVLLVSHNMAIIRSLSTKALLVDLGKKVFEGRPDDAIATYLDFVHSDSEKSDVDLGSHPGRLAGMKPILSRVRILNDDDKESVVFGQNDDLTVELAYDAANSGESLAGVGFILESVNGTRIGGYNTYMAYSPPHSLPKSGHVSFTLKSPRLVPGKYVLAVSAGTHQHVLIDKVERAVYFTIEPDDIYGTGFLTSPELGSVALDCDVRII